MDTKLLHVNVRCKQRQESQPVVLQWPLQIPLSLMSHQQTSTVDFPMSPADILDAIVVRNPTTMDANLGESTTTNCFHAEQWLFPYLAISKSWPATLYQPYFETARKSNIPHTADTTSQKVSIASRSIGLYRCPYFSPCIIGKLSSKATILYSTTTQPYLVLLRLCTSKLATTTIVATIIT